MIDFLIGHSAVSGLHPLLDACNVIFLPLVRSLVLVRFQVGAIEHRRRDVRLCFGVTEDEEQLSLCAEIGNHVRLERVAQVLIRVKILRLRHGNDNIGVPNRLLETIYWKRRGRTEAKERKARKYLECQ